MEEEVYDLKTEHTDFYFYEIYLYDIQKQKIKNKRYSIKKSK